MAHLIEDAGADYMFKDLPGAGSTPLAFETVFDKAIHADIWLVKYNQSSEMTYNDLRSEYTPYENFDAFKKNGFIPVIQVQFLITRNSLYIRNIY